MYVEYINNLKFYRWSVFDPWKHRMTALLSTRHDGTGGSSGEGLNLAESAEDYRGSRARISAALGDSRLRWFTGSQVHGTRIAKVSSHRGTAFESCDAILVDENRKLAAILLADCHPVIIYDPLRHSAVLAHAGWRGTVEGIAVHAVEAMKHLGSKVSDLHAAAGPGIASCCFTVRKDAALRFMKKFPKSDDIIKESDESGYWNVNLENANYRLLRDSGIPPSHIGRAGFCTSCRNDDFYSYRKEGGKTGRYASVLILE